MGPDLHLGTGCPLLPPKCGRNLYGAIRELFMRKKATFIMIKKLKKNTQQQQKQPQKLQNVEQFGKETSARNAFRGGK